MQIITSFDEDTFVQAEDYLDADGDLRIKIHENSNASYAYLNRDEAKDLVDHLVKVADLTQTREEVLDKLGKIICERQINPQELVPYIAKYSGIDPLLLLVSLLSN